jgi:uncharacterized membrane protein YphA (DoxX/SURF4 family)
MNNPNLKKNLIESCRILLGAVFVFSGFVKAVDPWGSAYKIMEYLASFGFSGFDFSAIPLAFVQASVEFGIGACLLLGIYRWYNAILALLFMLVMTPLTLYLAITNPITDCGCFGDAVVISNWLTFVKNIFLLAAAIVLYLWPGKMKAFFTRKSYSMVTLWVYLFIVGVSTYCYTHLPVLDFRPYKVGANITQLMKIPDDAEHPVYKTVLIYAKDGVQQEFTIDNYPKGDDSWTFVDSKTELIKKGYEPPIHDFSITTEDKYDITEDVLADSSYTFLLIAHNLEKASDANVDKINEIFDYTKANGYNFYALTASSSEHILKWTQNTGAEYPFGTMDETPLKTIIRSNPGLLLLKGGTIVNKWPNNRLPDVSKLDKPLEEVKLGNISKRHSVLNVIFLAFILLIPIAALFLLDAFYYRKQVQESKQKRKQHRSHSRHHIRSDYEEDDSFIRQNIGKLKEQPDSN